MCSPPSRRRKAGRSKRENVGAGTGQVAVWLEGRDRNFVAKAASEPWRVHGWGSGADEILEGVLNFAGAPVGQELVSYYLHKELQQGSVKDKATDRA